jgi:hypothetical protein
MSMGLRDDGAGDVAGAWPARAALPGEGGGHGVRSNNVAILTIVVFVTGLGVGMMAPRFNRTPTLAAPQAEPRPEILWQVGDVVTFKGLNNRVVTIERPTSRPCPDVARERTYRETLLRSGVFGRIEHGAP